MTDARLPAEWLGQMAYDDLDDRRWRIYSYGLMWCNAQETDGYIPRRYLARLHPDGATSADAEALVVAGLWEIVEGGWAYPEWSGRLRQSTAAEVRAYKESGRQRAANSRARALGLPLPFPKPTGKPPQSKDATQSDANVPKNVRPNAPTNVGAASRPASASASAADASDPVMPDSYDDWHVAPIGQELHEGLEVF